MTLSHEPDDIRKRVTNGAKTMKKSWLTHPLRRRRGDLKFWIIFSFCSLDENWVKKWWRKKKLRILFFVYFYSSVNFHVLANIEIFHKISSKSSQNRQTISHSMCTYSRKKYLLFLFASRHRIYFLLTFHIVRESRARRRKEMFFNRKEHQQRVQALRKIIIKV